MKKTLYRVEQAELSEGACTLKYLLIENEIEIDGCILKCYGVEIRMISSGLSEVKQIPNAFFKRTEARAFLETLARNTVTPIALAGVLDDYITDALHSHNRRAVLV